MMKNKSMILVFNILLIAMMTTSTFCLGDPVQPKNVISKAKAQRIALKAQKGKINASELEYEKKTWIYSFEIIGKDNKIHEINVDALSGKIVSKEIETPNMEAQEGK